MVESLACERDEDAGFEAFYDASYERMARLGFLLTGSAAVGEELAQDAFVQLYRSWDDVRDPGAWVRTVLVNGSRSWWRRAKRRPPAPELPVAVDQADVLAVRAALADLGERHRTALVLRFFEDLPEREIAALMGCPVGTVKSLLHRGLHRMREELS